MSLFNTAIFLLLALIVPFVVSWIVQDGLSKKFNRRERWYLFSSSYVTMFSWIVFLIVIT